jgi:hypothetical protein
MRESGPREARKGGGRSGPQGAGYLKFIFAVKA